MTSFDDLARTQRGYIDLAQAAGAGLTQHQINRLVSSSHWQRPHPGVYRTGSVQPEWEDKVRAACLAAGPGARAMGRTAARLHGLDGADRTTLVELTVAKGHGPVPAGVKVHETRRIDPTLTATMRGIPVSSINQTLLEYAWLVRADLPVERAIEDAFRRKDTGVGPLLRFLASCGRGVNGVTHLRSVLAKRPDGRPARSGFEVIVLDVLRERGLPLPVRRPLVTVPPDQKFELDLAYLDEMIDIEPMGDRWHATPSRRRADAERRRTLNAIGWLVLDVTWREATRTPDALAARVHTALESRR